MFPWASSIILWATGLCFLHFRTGSVDKSIFVTVKHSCMLGNITFMMKSDESKISFPDKSMYMVLSRYRSSCDPLLEPIMRLIVLLSENLCKTIWTLHYQTKVVLAHSVCILSLKRTIIRCWEVSMCQSYQFEINHQLFFTYRDDK